MNYEGERSPDDYEEILSRADFLLGITDEQLRNTGLQVSQWMHEYFKKHGNNLPFGRIIVGQIVVEMKKALGLPLYDPKEETTEEQQQENTRHSIVLSHAVCRAFDLSGIISMGVIIDQLREIKQDLHREEPEN